MGKEIAEQLWQSKRGLIVKGAATFWWFLSRLLLGLSAPFAIFGIVSISAADWSFTEMERQRFQWVADAQKLGAAQTDNHIMVKNCVGTDPTKLRIKPCESVLETVEVPVADLAVKHGRSTASMYILLAIASAFFAFGLGLPQCPLLKRRFESPSAP
ncbi:MAG: hypothetical protein WC965_08195 [Thiohalomonadaceae bacterium]|jgi:hypothetical protein